MQKHVYVVNKGPHDYSEAEAFGKLVFCTDGSMDRYDIAQMYREVAEAMRDSQEDDFILLTSLTTLCVVTCSVFVAKHSQLHLLLHTKEGYIPRTLHLKGALR